jgi:hypothetical protein
VLAFLPHGSATCRVDELRRSARTRFELEALAIEKYERDVVGYRSYVQQPELHLQALAHSAELRQPRRSMA